MLFVPQHFLHNLCRLKAAAHSQDQPSIEERSMGTT